ncbi:DUF5689 domain-containing protein [Pedobacter sp. BMA]|uniref:DUF5689 domain-containing protein n=1 Tax=Pedobacter sp. BMA TaxID=1663685 RepID=UPI00069E3CAB|nr:DUF5689 domain-containing protein [Pedobacter sp. BMA]
MKKISIYITVAIACFTAVLAACKRDSDYILSSPGSYISNLDLRKLYKGNDITLTKEIMRDAYIVKGQVVSDHSAGNIPSGLLFIQNKRTSGNGIDSLRGIAVNIGSVASSYIPGDSVHVNIEGGVLKRVNGILQITGISSANVTKVATNIKPFITSATAVLVVAKPENFESCLVVAYDCNFDPNIGVETLEGDKKYNDGSGDMEMHVGGTATFKSTFLPYSANVSGLCLPSSSTGKPQIWPRTAGDFVATSIVVDPTIPLGLHPAIVTGYLADPQSTDANYEYIQFMATQDLDFRRTPFSVYACNNAGASTPTGFPTAGWNTGDLRTFKFNITKGTVSKGQFFYVGGYKLAYGIGSKDISSAKWVANKLYASVPGDDGIGSVTINLLANSGNPAGIAIFPTTTVSLTTVPSDAIFFGGMSGSMYSPGAGYSIATNEFYKVYNGTAYQPFFRQGTNTPIFPVIEAGKFSYLGGVYNTTSQTWTTSRIHNTLSLSVTTTTQASLETMSGASRLTK